MICGRHGSDLRPPACAPHPQDCAPSISSSGHCPLLPDLEVVASGASAAWISPSTAILGLANGSLLALHLRFDGPTDQRIQVPHARGGEERGGERGGTAHAGMQHASTRLCRTNANCTASKRRADACHA